MTLGPIVKAILANIKARREGRPLQTIELNNGALNTDDLMYELVVPFFDSKLYTDYKNRNEVLKYALLIFNFPYSYMRVNDDIMEAIWEAIQNIENDEYTDYEYDYDTHREMRFAFEYFEENYCNRCKRFVESTDIDYRPIINEHWAEIISEEEDIRFEQEFLNAISLLMKNKKDELEEFEEMMK